MSDSKLKYYNAWFSPFAQRVWIALLHKKVDFEFIEQNPYRKTPEFLAINPRGMVPVLIDQGKVIYESPICLEYIDEARPSDLKLLPTDPYKRAHARIWADFVSKKLCPPFYACLEKQDPEGQEKEKQKLLTSLYEFTEAMDKEGPFFQGDSFGFVDIMYVPFALRFPVLKFYRGLELPQDPRLERFHKWWRAVREHPSVKPTLQDEQRLMKFYTYFTDPTTREEVVANL